MTEYITHHHLLEAGACADGVARRIVDLGRWWVRADEVPPLAAAWLYGDGGYGGYGYGDGEGGGYGYGYGDGECYGDGGGYGYGYGYGDGYGDGDGYGYGYGYGGYGLGGYDYGDGECYGDGKSACADALAKLEGAK